MNLPFRRKRTVMLWHKVLVTGIVALAFPMSTRAADSFTPQGATRIEVKVGKTTGFIFKPAATSPSTPHAWLWYAPTLYLGRAENDQLPNASTHWLFTRLLEKGIWIAGVDVGESYGAPRGRATFSKFYKKITREYQLSRQPCLLVQSRGGLMGIGWAKEHAEDVACIGGIYPVVNLMSWPPEDSSRFADAASAYGFKSSADFSNQRLKLSPLNHVQPLVHAGIPIFILHGDSDHIVPLHQNSEPFVKAYRDLGGNAELQIIPGKGHQEVDEFFKSDKLLQFFLAHLLNQVGQPTN
jgi:pimeloyl-ACP methyl ester carboxylesterase